MRVNLLSRVFDQFTYLHFLYLFFKYLLPILSYTFSSTDGNSLICIYWRKADLTFPQALFGHNLKQTWVDHFETIMSRKQVENNPIQRLFSLLNFGLKACSRSEDLFRAVSHIQQTLNDSFKLWLLNILAKFISIVSRL